jgi:hypothetical protein
LVNSVCHHKSASKIPMEILIFSWWNLHVPIQCGAPQVISWFINPINYSYKYHKP